MLVGTPYLIIILFQTDTPAPETAAVTVGVVAENQQLPMQVTYSHSTSQMAANSNTCLPVQINVYNKPSYHRCNLLQDVQRSSSAAGLVGELSEAGMNVSNTSIGESRQNVATSASPAVPVESVQKDAKETSVAAVQTLASSVETSVAEVQTAFSMQPTPSAVAGQGPKE